jgi:hypothetical protein
MIGLTSRGQKRILCQAFQLDVKFQRAEGSVGNDFIFVTSQLVLRISGPSTRDEVGRRDGTASLSRYRLGRRR